MKKLTSRCLTSLWTSDLSILRLTVYYDWSQHFKMRYITLILTNNLISSEKENRKHELKKYYITFFNCAIQQSSSKKSFSSGLQRIFQMLKAAAAWCNIYSHIHISLSNTNIKIIACINKCRPVAINININTCINKCRPNATYMYINLLS